VDEDVLRCSVHDLVLALRDALRAFVPIADRLVMPWQDEYQHPDWRLFEANPDRRASFSLWRYRQVLASSNFIDKVIPDVTVVNWPQLDYWDAPLLAGPEPRLGWLRAGTCRCPSCTGCRPRAAIRACGCGWT
jgi:hypothetical protein